MHIEASVRGGTTPAATDHGPARQRGNTVNEMPLDLAWLGLDSQYTPGGGPYMRVAIAWRWCSHSTGGPLVIFYLGNQPWKQRQVTAGSIGQGKRFAERRVRARVQKKAPRKWVTPSGDELARALTVCFRNTAAPLSQRFSHE